MTIYDAMFNYGRYDPALPAHQFRPETILADSRESLTDLAVCCPLSIYLSIYLPN